MQNQKPHSPQEKNSREKKIQPPEMQARRNKENPEKKQEDKDRAREKTDKIAHSLHPLPDGERVVESFYVSDEHIAYTPYRLYQCWGSGAVV